MSLEDRGRQEEKVMVDINNVDPNISDGGTLLVIYVCHLNGGTLLVI
jgi:hypothetical protein